MVEPVPEKDARNFAGIRDELARTDEALADVAPILGHLLAAPDQSLFSDEIIARVRGMCLDLADQVLRAQGDAAGPAGRKAFAETHRSGLAQRFFKAPNLILHCHALAIEWQLVNRMEAQSGLDPVLSSLIQKLIASDDSAISSAAMAALSAQARFTQYQRRMELPLRELPADLFHELLVIWRQDNGGDRSDAMIRAEAKLRNSYDEASGRLSLLAKLIAGMGKASSDALDIEQSGAGLFLSAIAARSRQPRIVVALACHQTQVLRLALGLRAAGLDAATVESQIFRVYPQAVLPNGFYEVSPEEASRWLSQANVLGAN